MLACAPQLSVIPTSRRTDILTYVNTSTPSPLAFDVPSGGDTIKYRHARIYMAAHVAVMDLRRGIGGALTSEKIGSDGVDLSYAAPFHGAIAALETTSYGLEYMRLLRSTTARLPVVL